MGTISQCIVKIDACIPRARRALARGAEGANALDPAGVAQTALVGIEVALAELREAEEQQLRAESRNLLTTQRLLEKERRRYADLFDLAPDTYFVTDAEGVIHEANHAASFLLDVPLRFLFGLPLINFVALADRAALRQNLLSLHRRVGPCEDAGSAATVLADFVSNLPRRGVPFEAALKLSPVREATTGDLLNRLEAAQEEERRRISRELHDQMGQHLTALALGLKALEAGLEPASPAGRQLVALLGMAETMGRDAHRLAVELRPPALDDLGLEKALRGYVEDWAQRTGVRTDFHANGYHAEGPRPPGSVEPTLYRVVQEALNNILKHASATRAGVLLHCRSDHMMLIVEDDGCGFDGNGLATGVAGDRPRLGLLGLQERVALVGGEMTVESAPGSGTTLFVRLPLTEGGAAQKEEGDAVNDSDDGRGEAGDRRGAGHGTGAAAACGAGGRPRDRARGDQDAGERAAGHGGGRRGR
jgi:signal transduction histidine kinase